MAPVDLIRDRLAEFQELARQKGTLLDGEDFKLQALATPAGTTLTAKMLGKGATEPAAPAPNPFEKGAFMRDFFEEVKEINGVLSKGRANVKSMGELLNTALQATTPEQQKKVSESLNDTVEDTNAKVLTVKNHLEELKRKFDDEGEDDMSAEQAKEREIKSNMQNQLAKKHSQLLIDFQRAQQDYKEQLNRRQTREIQMVLPDMDEEEVREMIDRGESLSMVVAKRMAGTHCDLLDELNRIQDKHQDILRLERSMQDLAQMFQEMAVLVDSQGEMLDAIEHHVHKAKGYTEKAEANLITTRKTQHKNQKMMCCLAAIMLIIALAMLLPIITSQ